MPGIGRDWWDSLGEAVVLLAGDRVVDLNRAAAELLNVDRARARGATAISVLRDHRLEVMWLTGVGAELDLRSRRVVVDVMAHGLVLRDVTDLRAEQRAAEELLGVLSHELRTPVTVIRGALEAVASGGPAEPASARFLKRAEAEAERLTRLLDDLTAQARPPRERSVALLATAARAATLLQGALERTQVTVRVVGEEQFVWVDEDKLLQVILNLIENAVVHGPAGSEVEVAAWGEPGAPDQGRRAGGWARLEVRDAGAALDPAVVPSLFEPHTQGGAKNKGTGLGLYIVRSIAQRWGGTAWGGPYRPDPTLAPVGNAFGVSLPLAPGA